jgi:hypothetical protein
MVASAAGPGQRRRRRSDLTRAGSAFHHRRVSAVWTCPVCNRKVPIRVLECYCGVRKQQVVLPALARQAREEQAGGWKWSVLGWVTAGALLVALVAQDSWRRTERASTESPAAGAPIAPQPPPRTVPPVTPEETLAAATPRPPVIASGPGADPEPTPTPSPVPSPRPSPTPTPSMVDDARARGAYTYQAAISGVMSQVRALDREIQQYLSNCGNSANVYPVTGCDSLRENLEEGYHRIVAALDDADEQARRAWVEPGTQRQIRAQLGVDEALAALAASIPSSRR